MPHTLISTAIGDLTVIAADDAITGLYFPGHRYPPTEAALGERVEPGSLDVLGELARQLHEYFAGTRRWFDVPVRTVGSAVSQRIWDRLREIPYGETVTYGRIARELGNPSLAQRVGQAVGHNPISIVIPCHRVVGADGSLTGFAGGLERKQRLLELEESEQAAGAWLF